MLTGLSKIKVYTWADTSYTFLRSFHSRQLEKNFYAIHVCMNSLGVHQYQPSSIGNESCLVILNYKKRILKDEHREPKCMGKIPNWSHCNQNAAKGMNQIPKGVDQFGVIGFNVQVILSFRMNLYNRKCSKALLPHKGHIPTFLKAFIHICNN